MVRYWFALLYVFCSSLIAPSTGYSLQNYLIIDNASQFLEFDPGSLIQKALGSPRPVHQDLEVNQLEKFILKARSSIDIEIY